MAIAYLAIERDDAVHERESAFWLSKGVSSIRVYSMTEGIEEAMKRQFLYIGINAGNINYKPQLPLLREATNDPVFIATPTYTMQEQGEAVRLGADLFGQISDNPNDNYNCVMDNVDALQERSRRRKTPPKYIPYGKILVAPKQRQVFIKDAEVKLTPIDYDLLHYFLNNRGIALSSEQIYNRVWKSEDAENIEGVVKAAVGRLRKKIDEEGNEPSFIENLWGVGYRLPTNYER